MASFVRVASVDEIPPGTGKEVLAGGRPIALFNVGGKFCAIDGVCPHQGGPLGEGELGGSVVTCPWHGWEFDVASGASTVHASIRQTTYEVRVEGKDVYVGV